MYNMKISKHLIPKDPAAFLQNLQDALIKDREANDSQAEPIYYGIADMKEELRPDGYGDHVQLYDVDSCEHTNPVEVWNELDDDVRRDLAETLDTGILTDADGKPYLDSEDDFANYLCENWSYEQFAIETVQQIQTDTLFLTRDDAKAFLDANSHHYTKNAVTYAMTAWRSPRYETLLWLLMHLDFQKSQLVLKDPETENT